MATRMKTIEYWWPARTTTVVSGTLTAMTALNTITIPESGKTFKNVSVEVMANDITTAAATSITARNIHFSLGAVGLQQYNTATTYTMSGENVTFVMVADVTGHFTTNWTGTSMNGNLSIQITQSGGTTTGFNNITAKITITYEYDDTSATQVKTVFLPLNAPTGALATSKPGSATAVIPALDTWLPENSKNILQYTIVVQGNDKNNVNTTDLTLSVAIDAQSAVTSAIFEASLISDRWIRFTWQPTFTTNATHDFFLWGNQAKMHHAQAWMVITYTFTPSGTTSVMNSLMLPMEFESPFGSSTTEFVRASRDLSIQEPGPITVKESALYLFWNAAATLTTVGVKTNTPSWTTFTDSGTQMCGSNGLMHRCESNLGYLDRGFQTIYADVYRTSTSDLGYNASSFWILNYTSGVSSAGIGSHNHTVKWNFINTVGQAASILNVISAVGLTLPDTYYYISSIGFHYQYMTNSTGNPAGLAIQVEDESSEKWMPIYADISHDDPETGVRHVFATARTVFKRWGGDTDNRRLDVTASHRYRTTLANNAASFEVLDMMMTYHTITYTVSGTVTGSDGATIYLGLHRDINSLVEDKVMKTTRTGDGPYSLTWYDNTETVYVSAWEDDTNNAGRSADGAAS
jgi:hypothetical protein